MRLIRRRGMTRRRMLFRPRPLLWMGWLLPLGALVGALLLLALAR